MICSVPPRSVLKGLNRQRHWPLSYIAHSRNFISKSNKYSWCPGLELNREGSLVRVYSGGLQHTGVEGMGVLSLCCPSGSLHSVSDGGRVPGVRPGAGGRAQKEQLETSEDDQKGERPWKLREEPDPRGMGLRNRA